MKHIARLFLAAVGSLALVACTSSGGSNGPRVEMRWETGSGTSPSVTLMWSKGDAESLQSEVFAEKADGSFEVPGGADYSDFSMIVASSNGFGSCSIWVDGSKVDENAVHGTTDGSNTKGLAACEYKTGSQEAPTVPAGTPPTTETTTPGTTPAPAASEPAASPEPTEDSYVPPAPPPTYETYPTQAYETYPTETYPAEPYVVECLFGTPGPARWSDGSVRFSQECYDRGAGDRYLEGNCSDWEWRQRMGAEGDALCGGTRPQ